MRAINSKQSGVIAKLLAVWALVLLCAPFSVADTYQFGQHIEPAYEGWRPNEDGTFSFMFGYMNENWSEEPDVDIGENNFFSPGEPDRGQPTRFLPRRNRFTFEVVVPSDWGDRELVWTLNVNGVERKAYATLKADYLVDNMVIASETGSLGAGTSSPESRANIKPTVSVIGDEIRSVRVGEPLVVQTQILDDGLPKRRAKTSTTERELTSRMLRPPTQVTVGKTNGLFLSWNVYRGAGKVTVEPPMPKPWEDTRSAANSPWGDLWLPPVLPLNGVFNNTFTFDEPGTYIMWARADDGGLYNDDYITVVVSE